MVNTPSTRLSLPLLGYSQHLYFLQKSIEICLLPSSHMNLSSRGGSTLCQIYPKHHNSPLRLFLSSPGFPNRLFSIQGHFSCPCACRGAKTSWVSCRWTLLWLTPSQARNCWNFRSSGSALASREEEIWEQSLLQKCSVHFLQHIAGWRSGSSIPVPRARIGLAGSQSRPFLPRRDANNLFPLQLPGLAAGSVPFPPRSASRGQTYPSKPSGRQGRREALPPRGCGESGGFSTGGRTAAPGGAGRGGVRPEETRGRGAPRSPEEPRGFSAAPASARLFAQLSGFTWKPGKMRSDPRYGWGREGGWIFWVGGLPLGVISAVYFLCKEADRWQEERSLFCILPQKKSPSTVLCLWTRQAEILSSAPASNTLKW